MSLKLFVNILSYFTPLTAVSVQIPYHVKWRGCGYLDDDDSLG